MSSEIDTDEIVREYLEGEDSKGTKVAITILALLLVAAAGAAILFGMWWSDGQKSVLEAEQQLQSLNGQLNQLETRNSELSARLTDKQAELERFRNESEARIAELEKRHIEQVQRTYAQMDEIVYDSRKTLEYIGTIEDKLKAGQALDEQEAEKLRTVVTGLTFLHQQYGKPIHEFRELERFLTEQLNVPRTVPPQERYGLLRRIFKSKEFKAEQASFYKEEGQLEAFERARSKVSDAYARAQSQMKGLALDSSKYLGKLEEIVATNEASAADAQEFFDTSREILKIHDRIMKIEPEEGLRPPVKP